MSKMADKDELRALQRLAGKTKALGVKGAMEAAEATDQDIIKRLMSKAAKVGADVAANTPPPVPGSAASKIAALEKMLGKTAGKGIKKAAVIGAGPIGMMMSGAAEAADSPEAGESPELEGQMLAEAAARQAYKKSPAGMDAAEARGEDPYAGMSLREKALKRGQDVLERQDPQKVREEMAAMRAKIRMLAEQLGPSKEESARLNREAIEEMAPEERKKRALEGANEMNRMLLEKGLLK